MRLVSHLQAYSIVAGSLRQHKSNKTHTQTHWATHSPSICTADGFCLNDGASCIDLIERCVHMAGESLASSA